MPIVLALTSADWEKFSDQATVVGVFIALCVGIATTVVMTRQEKATREGQKVQQEIAESTAARSESAAALSEEYTRRVVEALEVMARSGPRGEAAARPAAVSWSLTHVRGDSFLLHNNGDATARDVRVTAHESLILRPPDPQDLAPNEAVKFIASLSLGTRDSTISVSWKDDESGEVRTWKYPLPSKR